MMTPPARYVDKVPDFQQPLGNQQTVSIYYQRRERRRSLNRISNQTSLLLTRKPGVRSIVVKKADCGGMKSAV